MREIRAFKQGRGFPLSFARVNSTDIMLKTGKGKYENASKGNLFKSMKKAVVVGKGEEVVFNEEGPGEISSIVLPCCDEASVNFEVDATSYNFKLKAEKSEQQRCVVGFAMSDLGECEKISNLREKGYPDHLCAVEIISATKAKQLALPVLQFDRKCRITVSCKGVRPKQLGAHCGVNYLLLTEFN